MNNTSSALKIIGRSIDKDPELLAMLKDSSVNAQVSMIIYDVRKQAGLTQRQLADLVGTTRSVIARLEDADYYFYILPYYWLILELNKFL
jgi:ribosome-binding protein aMBF1 (putative translation factor)